MADALIRLRDEGRVTAAEAAHAIYDMDRPRSRFITASVIHAVAEFLAEAPPAMHVAA